MRIALSLACLFVFTAALAGCSTESSSEAIPAANPTKAPGGGGAEGGGGAAAKDTPVGEAPVAPEQ